MDASRGNAICIATSAVFSTATGIGQDGWHPACSAARYIGLRVSGIKISFKVSCLMSSAIILYLLTFRFADFQANGSFVYFPGFYATGEPADTRIYGGTGIF